MQLSLDMKQLKIKSQAQTELVNEIGKKETREYDSGLDDEDLLKNIHEVYFQES